MIYHIYFAGLTQFTYDPYGGYSNKYSGEHFNAKELLAKFIKESENNTFVFIVTTDQHEYLKKYLHEFGLNNLIQFKFDRPVTNANYPERGRRLWMYVLQTEKHFVNDLYEEAEESLLESEESNEH